MGGDRTGDERAWLRGRLRTANGWEELRGRLRTAADGVGASKEWLEMGEEKKPLVMSELGCGWQMGGENCADGCGRRRCEGVGENGLGEEGAGNERGWLRGRLRTANGCGELRGWLRTAWVQRSGWKGVGEKKPLVMSELGSPDGCGRQMGSENCADGCGQRATEWLEMGGEKKPLAMSELGCADGCGRETGAENCADSCGRREQRSGMGLGEAAAGDE